MTSRSTSSTGEAVGAAPPTMLPLFVNLSGRDVLVVGGGLVAERKIEELMASQARVRVVSPTATDAIRRWSNEGRCALMPAAFAQQHLDECPAQPRPWIVIAATDDPAAQRQIAEQCERLHIFCIAVDDPPNASAYGASVIRRPPFTIAISSRGEAPALSRLLREVLEQALPEPSWIEEAQALRARWKADGTPMASRFPELLRTFIEKARRHD